MPKQNPQRRRIRLPVEVYAEIGVIAVKGRAPVFACPAVAAPPVDALRRHAAATGVPVYAWCVRPDHVHLILGGVTNRRHRDVRRTVQEPGAA